VAEHSKDQDLAQVARLRLARVQIAQGRPDSALATLNGPQAGAFAARNHEVRGDAYYAKGDKSAALSEYRSAQVAAEPGADATLLGLKIADLSTDTPAPATAARSTPPGASK